jgi:hypothetical protein
MPVKRRQKCLALVWCALDGIEDRFVDIGAISRVGTSRQ